MRKEHEKRAKHSGLQYYLRSWRHWLSFFHRFLKNNAVDVRNISRNNILIFAYMTKKTMVALLFNKHASQPESRHRSLKNILESTRVEDVWLTCFFNFYASIYLSIAGY